VVGLDECRFGVDRKAWDLAFLAEAEALAGLRRVMRLHLELWGLPGVVYAAQVCVTELVTNVVRHVGPGTPSCLAVSMNGDRLRIEVSDPDLQALPTLITAAGESEAGRGMALVDGIPRSPGASWPPASGHQTITSMVPKSRRRKHCWGFVGSAASRRTPVVNG
jgi:anti-sigma regulatory factor (Ser/Thr protein kinase)